MQASQDKGLPAPVGVLPTLHGCTGTGQEIPAWVGIYRVETGKRPRQGGVSYLKHLKL